MTIIIKNIYTIYVHMHADGLCAKCVTHIRNVAERIAQQVDAEKERDCERVFGGWEFGDWEAN